MQTERRKSARWAGALAAWAALVCAVALGHPAGGSSANGRVFHAATGGAPVGLCAGGQVKPGRPGSPILRTLPIPSADVGVADEQTGHVFVVAHPDDSSVVCMLDARTGLPLRATPVGQEALTLAVDSLTGRVFVANHASRSVSVLDARTGALLRTVRLRGDPIVATVDAATGRVFLADGHDDLISVLDARSGALLHSVQDGGPLAIAVSAPPSRVLVADFEGGSVRVLDARTGAPLRAIQIGSGLDSQPQSIAVDPATARAFVSSQDLTLSVLDTRADRLLRTVRLDTMPAEVVADVPTGRVFLNLVPNLGGAIALFDARSGTPLRTIRLPDPARVEALDARTGRALAALTSPGGEITGKAPPAPGVSAILSLDGTTGAVRRRLDGFKSSAHLIAVDSRTRRAFATTGYTVIVLDLTRF